MAGLGEYLSGLSTDMIKPVSNMAGEAARKVGKVALTAGSAAGQSYVRQFFDSGVWDEGMFDEKESSRLSELVRDKVSAKKSGLSYKDYNPAGGKGIGYKGGVPDLSDPSESLKMTLGKASIVRDEQNNVMVVDEYDFASSKGLEKLPIGERIQALIDAVQSPDVSTYGVAHLFAEAFGATEGKGASIRAKVGSPEDLGLTPEDVQYLPTLADYQKQNKGRIRDRPVASAPVMQASVQETAPAQEPVPAKLKIKSGDTLSQLAKDNGTTVEALAKLNNIADVNKIYIGQELQLPSGINESTQTVPKNIPVPVGTVEDGYKFLGGDPSIPENWESI